MNCFEHRTAPAIGVCAACGRAVCERCVGRGTGRLLCASCASGKRLLGFEYRSETTIGSWPILHVCAGIDPATGRPRVAKGVVAIGNVAVGGLALGGVAIGLFSFGGLAVGLLAAFGGLAAGLGLSMGGLAIGSVAVGGLAIGLQVAVGGGAIGPAVISEGRCDPAAREFVVQWLGSWAVPQSCGR